MLYSECEQNCPVSLKADKLVVFPKKKFLKPTSIDECTICFR